VEQQLRGLLVAINEPNRTKWALEWRRQGGKVVGLLCSYVPEELIYAAGVLPWHIMGTDQANTSRALVYRMATSSLYCNRVLESFLAGELDFLDGVIATDREQDLVRLWDVLVHLKKTPFAHIMHVPNQETYLGYKQMAREINGLKKSVEEFSRTKITDESLRQAATVFNKMRTLLAKLYEMRKREVPPVSGTEAMAIVAAATIMPKDEFNRELEALLPYLEKRKASVKRMHPRLLLSSDTLYNPSYIQLVEQSGSLVAMDDLDPGSRYFWQKVDLRSKDLVYALAKRYLGRPAHPRMFDWDRQANQVIDWVKEYRIDGVLEMPEMYSLSRQFRVPIFQAKLTEANIPNISIPRFHDMADASQLRTRIEAFVEMLQARA
jgi:benzoyl-CoA reductase/2-hydroxyglutaryl-CoA dehydratase subunit BcrC/BadD/HgdB